MNRFFSRLDDRRTSIVLLGIIYLGFISLGLPDAILGVAWEPMHIQFDKPVYCAGWLATMLTVCSTISAFFSGAILRRVGTGKLLMCCGFLTGGALLGYALSPAFWCLMLFAIPLGFGQGAVDTGMNFYVAKHYTSRDMNWLHCCWGVGASLGPAMVTAMLAAGLGWRIGYATIAVFQLALALVFMSTLALWRGSNGNNEQKKAGCEGKVRYSLRFFCCPVMFFLYCGVEFSMGLWVFQMLYQCRGFAADTAGYAVAGYWGMLTVGRFLIGFVANRLGNRKQIRWSMLLGMTGGVMLAFAPSWGAMAATGLIGLAFAPFYPAMMHAAPRRFDDATAATVIGYQGGAGMLGGAVIPALFGYIASHSSFELLPYLVLSVCVLIFALQLKVDGWNFSAAPTKTAPPPATGKNCK